MAVLTAILSIAVGSGAHRMVAAGFESSIFDETNPCEILSKLGAENAQHGIPTVISETAACWRGSRHDHAGWNFGMS